MSISSIDPSVTQVNPFDPVSAAPVAPPAVDTDGDGSGTASVSPFAQVLSQLQLLQQTDPAKLKTVLGDVATQLQAAAQQDGGAAGQALSTLANKFQQASQTGDLSGLQPHHHHHGSHHGGAAAYQQFQDQAQSLPTSGSPASTPSSSDPRSQVLDIIQSVLASDLGTPAVAAG